MPASRPRVLAIAAAFLVVFSVAARDKKPPAPLPARPASPAVETLPDVLARFDAVQATIRTFSADFVQTTRNPLLKEPLVADGRFFLTKPDSVLWEYTSPEAMRLVVAGGQYTGYFPERKRAEKRDIRRWSEQLFRFFGLGQGSTELGKFYEIALGDPGSGTKDSYVLLLTPKKRRIKKSLDEARLWVDRASLLPLRIEYFGKDGNQREIRFLDARLNPDLAAGLYRVDLPGDVQVTNSFSGFDVATTRAH